MASLIDKEGNLYFGSLDGVLRFHPSDPIKTSVRFTNEDGMSSDLVYSMVFNKNTKRDLGRHQPGFEQDQHCRI